MIILFVHVIDVQYIVTCFLLFVHVLSVNYIALACEMCLRNTHRTLNGPPFSFVHVLSVNYIVVICAVL